MKHGINVVTLLVFSPLLVRELLSSAPAVHHLTTREEQFLHDIKLIIYCHNIQCELQYYLTNVFSLVQ